MKKNFIFSAFAILALASVACQKDNGEGSGIDLENSTSLISSLYVIESGLSSDPDGFNMISDGGFERFASDPDWKSKSLWWFNEGITESEEPCTGSRSIRLFYDGEGWNDLAVQTINVKKGKSYTLSLKYRGAWPGLNCYMGFRAAEGHDVNTNTEGRNDAWDEGYTYTWDNIDDTQATVFFGGWWWYNLWVELDDVRVIPTGSSNDSFIPSNASVSAKSVPSAASVAVTSAEKIVVSPNGDAGMLHNATIDGKKVENAYFTSGFNKSGNLVIASVADSGIKDFYPTAAITINGTVYVHGYSGFVAGDEENPATVEKSVILASTDGETWSEAISFGSSAKFAKLAFCKNGNYVYVYGCPVDETSVNTYLARVPESDFGKLSAFEYWDGEVYVKGNEDYAASVFYGPVDCMSVVYNATNYAYMAIYRSSTTGQLVYRDAGLAEGEWSGEKLLIADADGKSFDAPQIVSNSAKGFVFIASAK